MPRAQSQSRRSALIVLKSYHRLTATLAIKLHMHSGGHCSRSVNPVKRESAGGAFFWNFGMNKVRPIRIDGDVAYVPLTRGYVAIIDADNVHFVDGFNWNAKACGQNAYAARGFREKGKRRTEFLHRALMGNPAGLEIDHINGNGFDNRRANLRVVCRSVNAQNQKRARVNNKCGLLGVCWNKQNKRWKACIWLDAISKHLGYFDTPELAHAAYIEAKRKLHVGCTI